MQQTPSISVLEELFEETWNVAELAAMSADRHLVPRLLEVAHDILAWRNHRVRDASNAPAAAPISPSRSELLLPTTMPGEQMLRLCRMEELIARQSEIVDRLERLGNQPSVEAAYTLLLNMQESLAVMRRFAARRMLEIRTA